MKTFIREPFVHFVLIGAALFMVFFMVNDDYAPEDDKIVISQSKIQNLAQIFAKTWQRPPTREELDGLIEDHLKEEVFYREAMRVGLDEDDLIIRRRMRQKMEFIAEDLAALVEPTSEELQAYLDENMEYFSIPPRYSFRQVYIDPDKHAEVDKVAKSRIAQLNSAGKATDPQEYSDPLMLDFEFRGYTPADLERNFGGSFAEKIPMLAMNVWTGPVRSGYGHHLVYVFAFSEGRQPSLEEVRSLVRREWDNQKRKETLEAFYQSLKSQYTIEIEKPELATED